MKKIIVILSLLGLIACGGDESTTKTRNTNTQTPTTNTNTQIPTTDTPTTTLFDNFINSFKSNFTPNSNAYYPMSTKESQLTISSLNAPLIPSVFIEPDYLNNYIMTKIVKNLDETKFKNKTSYTLNCKISGNIAINLTQNPYNTIQYIGNATMNNCKEKIADILVTFNGYSILNVTFNKDNTKQLISTLSFDMSAKDFGFRNSSYALRLKYDNATQKWASINHGTVIGLLGNQNIKKQYADFVTKSFDIDNNTVGIDRYGYSYLDYCNKEGWVSVVSQSQPLSINQLLGYIYSGTFYVRDTEKSIFTEYEYSDTLNSFIVKNYLKYDNGSIINYEDNYQLKLGVCE